MASRYWVNGGGNWNDTSHWSTTDGGSSGASIPTTGDDVFITKNSGTVGTITVNGDDLTINKLSISPTVSGTWTFSLQRNLNITNELGINYSNNSPSYIINTNNYNIFYN